jgi:hypothetical protein
MSTVRPAIGDDVPAMLEMATDRREQYKAYQRIFWRPAADAAEKQEPFFRRPGRRPEHDRAGPRDRRPRRRLPVRGAAPGAAGLRLGRPGLRGRRLRGPLAASGWTPGSEWWIRPI